MMIAYPSVLSGFRAQSDKLFHVKRFGTIDALRKSTFVKQCDVQSRDLGQAVLR
jgi:hypothetical protein